MSKAERLIELMITINAKRDFTVGELAREFSVSKRTILRDLQVLESIGMPLYSEVGAAGGYHLLRERVLPPITFLENEAKAIFFAYQSLKFYRDLPFEQETMSALKKFLNCLPTDLQHEITQMENKIVFWVPDRHCSSPLLKPLLDSIMKEEGVTIEYSSQHNTSVRSIIPIGLYAMNGLWYCPAFCIKSNAIREFRVDRIKNILSIEKEPTKRVTSSIHEYLQTSMIESDCYIKIRLTDIGVKRCETEFLLAQGLKRSLDGGIIEMHIPHAYLEWVAEYLLPLGINAKVIEPQELVTIIQDKAKQLYYHHCKIKEEM